jgi:glycosyltransferase involved in cell wall biosynthesis
MSAADAPVVSVCVVTYKQDRYIEDCLLSVLTQGGDIPLEILVGNDGDSPETPGIVARLAQRFPGIIRYFAHEQNLGASRNYQFLVQRARGRYIAHLDGDDYWLPGKLRAQVAWMERQPDSPACYTNAVVIDESGRLLGLFTSFKRPAIDLPTLLERGNFLNHSSMLYRADHRDVVLEVTDAFVDYRLHLALARRGLLGMNERPLAVYRAGSEHSMSLVMRERVNQMLFDAIIDALREPALAVQIRTRALGTFWAAHVIESIGRRSRQPALDWYRRIRAAFPELRRGVLRVGVSLGARWVWRSLGRRLGLRRSSAQDLRVFFER